jgi:integrase
MRLPAPLPRRRKPKYWAEPDFRAIHSRRSGLTWKRLSTDYGLAKLRRAADLVYFLTFVPRSPTPSIYDCSPGDVADYLVYSGLRGRTIVHVPGCSRAGICRCPRTKAAGTIDSELGQLRAAMNLIGRTGLDNPCAHPLVKQYLKDITHEQAKAGVTPTQALPLFQEKLLLLVESIDELLARTDLSPGQRYILTRDVSIFTIDAACGQRGRDLFTLLTEGVLRFPKGDGFLFGYTWGKTLRSGTRHLFGIRARTSLLVLCPIRRLNTLMELTRSYGPEASAPGAYIFCPWRYSGPDYFLGLTSKAINESLQGHLRRIGIFEGETFHGIRAAYAIEACLEGVPLQQIMSVAQWSSEAMAMRYMRLQEVMALKDADVEATPALYQQLNSLRAFKYAFPGARGALGQ